MALTDQQATFLKKHVKAQLDWDAARRSERAEELRKLSEGTDRDAVITARSKLEAMLLRTGRMPDPAETDPDVARSQQAERKEAHLQEVILRDEDGLNVGQIVDAVAPPPDPSVRKMALRQVTEGMPPRERAEIEAAQKIMRDYEVRRKAADATVAEELEWMVSWHSWLGSSERVAKNAAMHAVAENHGQHSLSHHASRHGAHTTDEEQVRRVATGYAPDDLPPDVRTETMTTRTGEIVTMPMVSEEGPHGSSVASRFASAEIALFMIEDLMADVQALRARGEVGTGDSIKREVSVGAADPIIGDQAVPPKHNNQYQTVSRPSATAPGVMTAGGVQLTASRHLTGPGRTPEQKEDIVRDRATAAGIEANVRGATLIMRGLPDGSFRMVTAYPNAAVTSSATRNETRDMPLLRMGADDRTEPPSAAETALAEAEAGLADSTAAGAAAKVACDQSQEAARQAVETTLSVLTDLDEGPAREACGALQGATRAWQQAEMAHATLTQQHDDAKAAKTRLGRELGGRGNHVNALTVNRDAARVAATAAPADNALQRDLRLAEEALAEAQSALDFATAVDAGLDAQIAAYRAEVDKAAAERDRLAGELDTAEVAAKAAAGDATAQKAKDAALASTRALAAFGAAKLALDEAETAIEQAKLARSLAEEALAQRKTTPPVSARDRLGEALAEGGEAFDSARRQWAEDILVLETILADDRDQREKAAIALGAERDLLRQEELKAETALDEAYGALDRVTAVADGRVTPEMEQAMSKAGAAEKLLEELSARRRELTARHRDERAQLRNQAILDDVNIALAKARLEATAERLLHDAAGGADAETDKRVRQLEAEERSRAKHVAYREAVDAARLAKSAADIAAEELEAATEALDRMVKRGLGIGEPLAQAAIKKVDALTVLRDETEQALADAEAAREAAQAEMSAAQKAARALA